MLGVATGSYDAMPPNAIVTAYIPTESARRSFVDGMAEVQVKLGEVIMRQGARRIDAHAVPPTRLSPRPARSAWRDTSRARPASRAARAQATAAITST